jgi:hypothetical protein
MMIGVVVPVYNLDCFGYQRYSAACISSFCAWADNVILVQSGRSLTGLAGLVAKHSNLRAVSNENTWFPGDVYNCEHVARNRNLGAHLLRTQGCDVIVHLDCNWYMPQRSWGVLRTACSDGSAFIYRGPLAAGRLHSADFRLPNIHGPDWQVAPDDDSALTGTGELVRRERGYWPEQDENMLVDLGLEITWEELEAKMEFVGAYHDLAPQHPKQFDRAYWLAFCKRRQANWCVSKFQMNPVWGTAPGTFVSQELQ